jgi:hypothetical protein
MIISCIVLRGGVTDLRTSRVIDRTIGIAVGARRQSRTRRGRSIPFLPGP